MDCARLRLSIPNVSVANNGLIHLYGINVIYGKLQWTAQHRFSEFMSLNQTLTSSDLQALPPPPSKSITRPQDRAVLEERRIMLQNWIRLLCSRPDVRTCSPFLDFIEFELHTSTSVQPLIPTALASCQDGKYYLSDFQWCSETQTVIATYEETVSLSRVGKVWSLVEKDELGGLSIWRMVPNNQDASRLITHTDSIQINDTRNELSFEKILHAPGSNRFRSMYFHEPTKRIFVGLDNGQVDVYTLSEINKDLGLGMNSGCSNILQHYDEHNTESHPEYTPIPAEFIKYMELPLHSDSILSIKGEDTGPGRILSIGFDKSLRIVDCTTLQKVCGGSLTKRLDHKEHLTTAAIEPGYNEGILIKSRMFIGTTKGKVFIYSSTMNPPEHLHTIQCVGGGSIGALELAGFNLLVAHKYKLSIYRIGVPGEEHKATLVTTFQSDLTSGRTIQSIAVSITTPFLFLGHSRAITVWDCNTGACVTAFKAHYGGVCRLKVLENTHATHLPSYSTNYTHTRYDRDTPLEERFLYPVLLSGGRDGFLKVWTLGPIHDYKIWRSIEDPVEEDTNHISPSESTASGGAENFNSHNISPKEIHCAPQQAPLPPAEQLKKTGHLLPPPLSSAPKYTDVESKPIIDNKLSRQYISDSSLSQRKCTPQKNSSRHPQYYEEEEEDSLLVSADFTSAAPHRH